jgi:hypothetical protein
VVQKWYRGGLRGRMTFKEEQIARLEHQALLCLVRIRLVCRILAVHAPFCGRAPHHKVHRRPHLTFRENSGKIQGTFREHSGNIQGTVQGILRVHASYFRSFREHSGRVERTPVSLHPNCKKHLEKVPRLTQNITCKHEYLRRGLT